MGMLGHICLESLFHQVLLFYNKTMIIHHDMFLIFIYPVTEVLTSIIRKVFIRNRSAMEPDGLHFHANL